MKRIQKYFLMGIIISLSLSGCAGVLEMVVTDTPTPSPTATPAPTATKTPTPTITLTPEPTATATETPLIQGDIFFDPQSKEDFKNVVLAPSPIDEPEKFALWREEYLRLVNEKLINYDGPSLTTENMLISYDFNQLILSSSEWPVIASYIFDYQGEKILTKTFVFKDSNTNLLVPLSATLAPENSSYFAFEYGDYKTHRADVVEDMTLVYDYGQYLRDIDKEYSIKEPFVEAFFGDFISEEEYNAFVRVLFGEANKEDLESFCRQPFVLMSVVKRP